MIVPMAVIELVDKKFRVSLEDINWETVVLWEWKDWVESVEVSDKSSKNLMSLYRWKIRVATTKSVSDRLTALEGLVDELMKGKWKAK